MELSEQKLISGKEMELLRLQDRLRGATRQLEALRVADAHYEAALNNFFSSHRVMDNELGWKAAEAVIAKINDEMTRRGFTVPPGVVSYDYEKRELKRPGLRSGLFNYTIEDIERRVCQFQTLLDEYLANQK